VIDWTLFNSVDWVIVVVIAASVLLSLWRGFTREAISLAGWVAAFLVANMFSAQLAMLLGDFIVSITGRFVVAYAILFVLTLMVAGLLGKLGRQVVRVTGLSLLDRLLGTVFGFARGVIIVLVGVYLIRQLLPPQNLQWMHHSQLMPQIDMLVHWVQTVFAQFGQDLGPGLKP
jgi:membrane protein required for colicin V production